MFQLVFFFYFQELLLLYFKSYRTCALLQKQKYKTDINPEITSFHPLSLFPLHNHFYYFDLFFHCYLMLYSLNIRNSRHCSCLQSQNDAKTMQKLFSSLFKVTQYSSVWLNNHPTTCQYFLSAFCYYKLNFCTLVLIQLFSEYSWSRLCF